ncbi:Bystin-domain-containing protein [Parasitella parasitica]|nr:Bystin-domain-containing protein [Parasitella parasitica]
MGKDTNKNLLRNTATRLHSPWQLDDNRTWVSKSCRFGLVPKEDDFETYVDENMKNTILRIEKEQLERIAHIREEDPADDEFITKKTQRLDIHSSSVANQPIVIPTSDHQLIEALSVPQEQQKPLVTLKEAILTKVASRKDQSLPATDPQVIQIYKKIGCALGRFQSTHSRLPKALKIIPSLTNWDEILLLTNPLSWTPQATYEVTKLFLSNIKATQTKQFLQVVLLHAVRNNLVGRADGQLDPALYRVLKKVLVCNSALFLKGLLFPLCESNSCTVAEACILANVLGQTKIPALQSATALLWLSQQTFTLPICILIRVFLEKRQPLPYRVVDMLTFQYFCQREGAITQLPLTWYHSLQTFAQSYSSDMVPTQKRALLTLIQRVSSNDEISFAIEKTIKSAIRSNDYELETTDDSDDTVVYNADADSNDSDDIMLID